MSHDETHDNGPGEAQEHPGAHAHDHVEVVPNPDYDGPANHCLPPPVKDGAGAAIFFVILMICLALGAAWLGGHLFF
jgi:hypothetical protein